MDLSPRCGSKALLAPVLLLVIGALAACADNPPPIIRDEASGRSIGGVAIPAMAPARASGARRR